jgi:peptide/nickel transport system substrate-binding protein
MAHATNKSFIRDQVYMGLAQTGSTILSPLYGEWYWEPTGAEVLEYDLAKANMILDDAGYVWDGEYRVAPIGHPYGSVAQKTRLSYPVLVEQELFEDKATAEYMRSDWKKIGIEIEISLVDTAQWNTQVYGGAFEIAMTYWSGDPDPNYLLYTQSTKSIGGWSETWYSSAAYDENYSVSVVEQNRTKRTEAIKNCQEIMYNDCAFIVTVYPYGCYAWRTDTFSNWGDWAAHPYRSISNYWGANPLWFDLIPGEPSDGDGGGGVSAVVLGAAAGLIIAVVVIALVLLMMRRKGGRKEEEDVQLP